MRGLKRLVVGIAVAGTVALAAGVPVSADQAGPPSFTPDGVNWIPTPGQDDTQMQVLSYLNAGNFSPDGVNTLQNPVPHRQVVAMFSPDGINQIPVVNEREIPYDMHYLAHWYIECSYMDAALVG